VRQGVGIRVAHYDAILERGLATDFAEAITENFLDRGGRPLAVLDRVRKDVPIALHGVSLSIGGVDPVNLEYLKALRTLRRRIDALWVSDHLCFGGFGGAYAHDLWPLPYTEEALAHVVERVRIVQDFLGERILLENVSSYVEYTTSSMPEWEFLTEVAERADCAILLDVNNVHVSSYNHGFSPIVYLEALPRQRIVQLHLAGHSDKGRYLLDDHGSQVPAPVWDLYRLVCRRFGPIPAIVEWDENLPDLDGLVAESNKARSVEREALGEPPDAAPPA
jgi:uncharacterized protein